MSEVRAAGAADVDEVVATVAAAFVSDPAWSFMVGPAGPDGARAFARALLLPRVARGTAWIADDCAAVAMWDRRTTDEADTAKGAGADDEAAVWSAFRSEVGADVWRRLKTYDRALEAVAPPRPYWYLGVLATRPDAQGRGLATAVLQPGFDAAARDGWDCWLETSTTGNKAFYAGRGFTQSIEVDVPGGPLTWWLRRPSTR